MIKSAIENLGHRVRNAINIKSRIIKGSLPMFFVDLEPSPNNKNKYETKTWCNAIVNRVPPKKTNDLVQCHRCQEYWQTKTYCRKSVNCFKCGLCHLTINCTKDNDSEPRCDNCLQNHPARYKGYIVYKQLLKKSTTKNK